GKMVGAFARGRGQGLLPTPAADLLMVAAEEHFWHRPAAEFSGPRVVRVVEDAVTCGRGVLFCERNRLLRWNRWRAEGFLNSRGFIAQRAREQARHRVHNPACA